MKRPERGRFSTGGDGAKRRRRNGPTRRSGPVFAESRSGRRCFLPANDSTASGFPSPGGAASGSVPWATERRWRGATCRAAGANQKTNQPELAAGFSFRGKRIERSGFGMERPERGRFSAGGDGAKRRRRNGPTRRSVPVFAEGRSVRRRFLPAENQPPAGFRPSVSSLARFSVRPMAPLFLPSRVSALCPSGGRRRGRASANCQHAYRGHKLET